MAVFTPVDEDSLAPWLARRHVGQLVSLEGIASGIENTNYFVTTRTGRYVLTLFEKLTAEQLPFYLGLMKHLADRGLPVPGPVPSDSGELFSVLNGKPASLVNCLPGKSAMTPNPAQCEAIGVFCAKAHLTARNFPIHLPNQRGLSWWQSTQDAVSPFLPADLGRVLHDEITAQTAFAANPMCQTLPSGPVHADLFCDNALFTGDTLGGVIDFYFAGVDTWLFDLAVCINDWCIDQQTGAIQPDHAQAMIRGYQQHRPLTADEHLAWPMMLRAAALRFWMSRLYDYYMPREAQMLTPKDPTHFERILRLRQQGNVPAL